MAFPVVVKLFGVYALDCYYETGGLFYTEEQFQLKAISLSSVRGCTVAAFTIEG